MTRISKTLLTTFVLLTILLVSLGRPNPALAAGPASGSANGLPDQIVFGDTYTLESGETLDGDLVILGGAATLEKGSAVEGNVIILGGTLEASGVIEGSITIVGGFVNLSETAVVEGDITKIGGHIERATGARVEGEIRSETDGFLRIRMLDGLDNLNVPTFGWAISPIWDMMSFFFSVFVMAALAIGVVMFWPRQTERAAQAILAQPVVSGGMGLLTLVVLPFVLVAMAITLLLIPAIPLVALALVVIIGFGWIAIGLEIGKRLAQVLRQEWHPALAAGVGTLALTFVAMGIEKFVFCVGWTVPFAISVVGLGAVLLTRFGTRDYPGLVPAPAVAAPIVAAPVIQASQTPAEATAIESVEDLTTNEASDLPAGESDTAAQPARSKRRKASAE